MVKGYGNLHSINGKSKKSYPLIRFIIRNISHLVLPAYLKISRSEAKCTNGKNEVVVSLTSFPARIDNVWQVIECMLRQSYKPSKIILWLSKEQFPTIDSIPDSLKSRESDIFEIRIVEGDIRSHKKYYYVAKEFPNSLVFLVDDDIYYATDIIERTIRCYEACPNSVVCNYGFIMNYNNEGNLAPYKSWKRAYEYSESKNIFFGSGGGTLFCPSDLHPDLLDIDNALKLCPIADDVWLNTIVKISGVKVVLQENLYILELKNKGNITLSSENNGQNKNDMQINNVIAHYNNRGIDVFRKQ